MTDDGEDSTSQSMSPDSMDEERPLKKARYVWQIKGRYRWNHPRSRSCSSVPSNYSCQSSTNRSLRPVLPTEDGQCPITRWQTRQMARAVVDNTINQVLEDMGFVPPPDDEEDIISFDIFPSTHNREGIENEAVLMAIQSHGLQKPCHCSHSYSFGASSSVQNIPFHHRPSTPLTPEPSLGLYPEETNTPSTSMQEEKYAGETDFLAQAVAVAIQKKGLGSYSPTEHA